MSIHNNSILELNEKVEIKNIHEEKNKVKKIIETTALSIFITIGSYSQDGCAKTFDVENTPFPIDVKTDIQSKISSSKNLLELLLELVGNVNFYDEQLENFRKLHEGLLEEKNDFSDQIVFLYHEIEKFGLYLLNGGVKYEESGNFVEEKLDKYYSNNMKFFSERSLRDVRLKKEDILTDPRYIRNYTKRVLPIVEDWCRDDCKKVTRRDIDSGLGKPDFEQIESQNEYRRLYGIGDKTEVKEENSYLRIYGKEILEELTRRFKYKLKESGISGGWSIRPVITSLLRPEEQKIGSPNSVHPYGLGIDISFSRFDLIDTESGFYLDLNKTKDKNALVIRDYVQGLMAEVLDELDREGKIIFTNETRRGWHYHVSTLKVDNINL